MAKFELPQYPPISRSPSYSRKATDHKSWLENMVDHMAIMDFMLNQFIGGGDGIVQSADYLTPLEVVENSTPDMKIQVKPGFGFNDKHVFNLADMTTNFVSTDMVAPSANPRIDVVSIDPADGSIIITEGVEAGSPSAPATPSGHEKLAEIYHRTTETEIRDTDSSPNTEGYITDARTGINF